MMGMGTNRLMTTFMFIAVFSLLSISLSYNPQEAHATVTSGTATWTFDIVDDPADVSNPFKAVIDANPTESNIVYAFDEQQDVELSVDLDLDLAAPMVSNPISDGTTVSSTMVIFDPATSFLTRTQGCVEFAGQDILGIQFLDATLDESDLILGHLGVDYVDYYQRGIEPVLNADLIFFVGPKVCFDLGAASPGDTFRVITTSDHVSTLLWQIGVFNNDRSELTTSGTINTYNADTNPINNCGETASSNCISPDFPALIGDRTLSPAGQTTNIDISFTSESCTDAVLIYSRAGEEINEIYLDDVDMINDPIATNSFIENFWKTFSIELGGLDAGEHTITINYPSPQTENGINAVDALALVCWEDALPPTEITEISGMKFEDANADGDKAGDSGVENWEITLDCENDLLDAVTMTDVVGNYDFSFDLVVGDSTSCILTENTDDTDWSNSTPISIGPFDVTAGDVIIEQDFGNYQLVSIKGLKFEDTNANGVHDDGEQGLADVTITLTGTGNSPVELEQKTDANGQFLFTNLVPGSYTATEIVPTGYVATTLISSGPHVLASGDDLDLEYIFGNVEPFFAEKTWTHTDYNWDEICTDYDDIIVDDEVVGQECVAYRPANINTDDVLADPLDVINNEFILLGNANKKGFQNTNPGAFFALTTVDVTVSVDSLTVVERYDDCTVTKLNGLTVPMLELLGSKQNIETALKAAIAAPNGDVTEISSKDIVTNMDDSSATVVIQGPIDAESTVYVLVKFSDALSGQDVTLPVSCTNEEIVGVTIDTNPFETTVDAILTIIEK